MIHFRCGGCGKAYRVPTELAGRRVKCKACGMATRVPAAPAAPAPARREAASADAGDNVLDSVLAEMAQVEEIAHAAPASSAAPPPSGRGRHQPPPARRGLVPLAEQPRRDTVAATPAPSLPAPSPRMPLARGRGTSQPQYGDFADSHLPKAIIFIALVAHVVLIGKAMYDSGQYLRIILAYAIFMGGFCGVGIPVASLGVRLTSRLMHFELPESLAVRTGTILLFPTACGAVGALVGYLLQPDQQGLKLGTATGVAGSFLLSPFVIKEIYHLPGWLQTIVTAVATFFCTLLGGFAAGCATTMGVGLVAGVLSAGQAATNRLSTGQPQSRPGAVSQSTTPAPPATPLEKALHGGQTFKLAPMPADLRLVPQPPFPPLPQATAVEPAVRLHEATLSDTMPGGSMRVWIYLPNQDHAPASLACALIAPAGSSGLTGIGLGDGDRVEHLPYARAGIAVVAYELDGYCANAEDPQSLFTAVSAYRAASAGLVNARNALAYATAQVPAIDPKRVYAVGHSSAGAVALRVAALLPDIAGCVAFASPSDFGDGQQSELAMLDQLAPGIQSFAREISPANLLSRLRCPVLLFHAEHDTVVPARHSRTMADRLSRLNQPVTLRTVPGHDHHQPMIDQGIPVAIEWISHGGKLDPQRERLRQLTAALGDRLGTGRSSVRGQLVAQPLDVVDDGFTNALCDAVRSVTAEAEIAAWVQAIVKGLPRHNAEMLRQLLQRGALWHQKPVVEALAGLKDPASAPLLAGLIADRDCGAAAVAGLIALGPAAEDAVLQRLAAPGATDAVLHRLAGPGSTDAVLSILMQIGTAKCVPIVRKHLVPRQPTALAARQVILRVDPGGIDPFTDGMICIGSGDADLQRQGLKRLAGITPGRSEAATAIVGLLDHQNADLLHPELGQALRAHWTPETLNGLLWTTRARDPGKRDLLLKTLEILGDRIAADLVARALSSREEFVREAVVRLGATCEPHLLRKLNEPRQAYWETDTVIGLLGEVGGRDSMPPLMKFVGDRRNRADSIRAGREALAAIQQRLRQERVKKPESADEAR